MQGKILLLLAFVMLISGCASQATLTVLSQPEGAYVIEKVSGKGQGISPIIVNYDAKTLQRHKDGNGCYRVQGFDVKWASGASASLDTVLLCGDANGYYSITFSRDPNYPDLDKDLQIAMQSNSVRIQQQHANAIDSMAYSAKQMAEKPLKCISQQFGNYVKTVCK